MNIINLGLKFRAMTPGNTPETLYLHHTAGIRTVEEYHQMHLDKGWAGLGYNFVVALDGKIYKGRDPKYLPAGISGHNQNSLHIAAIGNFENMIMPEVQREAIKELVAYCKVTYPTLKAIKGHREVMATACPGKNYPLSEIKTAFTSQLIKVTPKPTAAPIKGKVFKLQHVLNAMGITDEDGHRLVEDGILGTHTKAALQKIVVHRGDKNLLVGWIQERLGVKVDNHYGAAPYHETYDTIVKYQKANGLKADGAPGFYTITKLAA